jgi:hypothetical protein
VANHVIYTTGDPPTNFGTYANPTSSVAGNEVYTSMDIILSKGHGLLIQGIFSLMEYLLTEG